MGEQEETGANDGAGWVEDCPQPRGLRPRPSIRAERPRRLARRSIRQLCDWHGLLRAGAVHARAGLSGTLPEESSFYASLGEPIAAVSIRTSTERPEALDEACFVLAGIDEKNLLQAVEVAVMNKNGCKPVRDYTDLNVSDKVVKIIQSYVGVVNKMVWRKDQ